MTEHNAERIEDVIGRDTPHIVEPDSDMETLVNALASQYDRLDADVQTVLEQTHVDTATGVELERLGDLVNTTRRTNETDAQLRQRIKIRGRVTVTSGTTNEMMELSALALECSVDDLFFPVDLAAEPATFPVQIPQAVLDDAVLSQSTVESELDRGVPVGHRVTTEVVADNTTQFATVFDAGFA